MTKMEYSQILPLEDKVSRFVLGTMFMLSEEDDKKNFDLLDDTLEVGINALDTGAAYGDGLCESKLGKYFKERGCRDDYFIITKCCHPTDYRKRVNPFDIESDLHDSLARLGTDRIDLYLLHRDDISKPVGPLMETLAKYQKQGKIRSYGVSNWTTDRIIEANKYCEENGLPKIVASSPNYSLAQQYREPWAPGCVTISGPENEKEREWYAKTQMPVMAYSSMARGLFSGRFTRKMFEETPEKFDYFCRLAYCGDSNFTRLERCEEIAKNRGCGVPQVALAFILDGAMNVFPIVGAANKNELISTVGALDLKLSPEEVAYLDLKTDKI